jgi:hypothetical protein
MSEQKKKIIFLDDSLDGGEDVPVTSMESSTPSIVNTTEQFAENTQFGISAENRGGDSDELEEAGLNDSSSTLDGGENMESTMVSDNVSIVSEKSELSDLISEGGRSSISSGSSVSTVNTADLLSVDPMYIRLTKFLETDVKLEGGGNKRVNVTELLSDISGSLKDINVTFKEMSGVLQKMALTNATQ